MSDRTFGRKKAGTSTFSNPSFVSPHTPTLANPVRGFGLTTNNVIQTATKESTNLQEAQAGDEQSLLSEAIHQRSFGHDISRIALRRPQAKLTVGEPDDQYEQEADWMANQVMRMVVPDKLNAANVQPVQNSLQRKCAACEEEEDKIQTKPSIQLATDAGLQAGDNIENRLNSSKGGGSPLPDEMRDFMEPRFGTDFSQVRVHTGTDAVQMNRDLSAQAFTHKQDIYFGAGKSPAKDALTAHELTHVVQQTNSVQRQLTPQQLRFPDVEFPTATAELAATEEPSASNPQLVSLAKDFQNMMATNPQAYINISGYLSGESKNSSEKESQNRHQILKRFDAVKTALTSLGVPGDKIEIQASPPFSDKRGGVIEVRSYKKHASLPSLYPVPVPSSPQSSDNDKPSAGGGLNLPDLSKYTKFSVNIFDIAQLNFDLPSSVAATLPFKAGGGKHVVMEFKAETSKIFSFSIKLQGLSGVELGASGSADLSGEQPKGKVEVGATATKQVCRADNAESLKSKMQAKAKELVEGVDALNKARKAYDGSLQAEKELLEKGGKVGGQLKDLYDLREKAMESCKPVPVGSLKIVGEAEKTDPTKPSEKPDLTKPAPLGNTIMLVFELNL